MCSTSLLLEHRVVDRQRRTAGVAEDMLHAVIDERAHDHRGAGHLIGIVALVGHGSLRMRLFLRGFCQFSVSSASGNKKGPLRPHAHRPYLDGS
jgi:hypothetical protein